MSRDIPPIARIRLARSLPRLMAWPILLLVAGTAAGVGAALVGGTVTILLAAVAGVLGLAALGWAAWLLSIRLDVEESEVRVHWIGGERRYALSPGPVTRVRFHGENASRLRARTGLLGYGLGPARLRDEERIHVVRLAPTATAILVPTEEGRLAIAPAAEADLLDALTRAARARQRLDDLARETDAAGAEGLHVDATADAGGGEAPPAVPVPVAEPPAEASDDGEPEARPMTGIERMLYERRLADERAAAEAAAEAALEALRLEEERAAAEAALPAPRPDSEPAAVAAPRVKERPARRGIQFGGVRLGHAVALVPLAGALAAWAVGTATDGMPDPRTDVGRLTALALVLAGPGSALGALIARTRWPQLVGVVIVAGLAASVLVGRAVLGN